MIVSRLYAIVDADVLAARSLALRPFAESLRTGGARRVQYRNKSGTPQQILADAAILSEVFAGTDATLVMNDRADLALLAGWNAVHVGQDDLPPAAVRRVLDHVPGDSALIGLSTHTDQQVRDATAAAPGYIAIGPVFSTSTKADAASVVGLEGVRRARALTHLPLVAIGGITLANARSVLDAGADAVAVISGLFVPDRSVEAVVEDFLGILR